MDNLDFSEEEIQGQLAILGYKNIPQHKLRELKQDLDELIRSSNGKTFASGDRAHVTHQPSPALYAKEKDHDDLIHREDRNTRASGDRINFDKPAARTLQPSPPAYTKEKVGRCYMKNCDEGFFLHPPREDRERGVLTTCQNGDHGRQQRCIDSYAQHSVAPKLRLPAAAPSMLLVEPDPEDTLIPPIANANISSHDIHGRRLIKRKVLRKHKGQSLVYDESFYSDDSASCVEERLSDLDLSAHAHRDSDTENDSVDRSEDDLTSLSSEADGISASALESYLRAMTRTDGDFRPKPKSFIRPVMSQQNIKKCDPVTRYMEYKQYWEMYKLPGEKDRRDLRWEIKERLAYQPPPPKPRRVLVPNTYIVPTEKKRSSLRWQIRNDLASGLLPHKFNYVL